jgi:hypothetical protein
MATTEVVATQRFVGFCFWDTRFLKGSLAARSDPTGK